MWHCYNCAVCAAAHKSAALPVFIVLSVLYTLAYLDGASATKLQQVGASTNDFGARTMMFVSYHHTAPYTRSRRATSANVPTITKLDVNCQITARFAETTIESHMENEQDIDLEVVFTVQLPEVAFISNFTMVIDGVLHIAQVMEKAEAEEAYKDAKDKNKTAGMVSSVPREPVMKQRGMEVFNVAVNIRANTAAQFTLEYLQLLQRDLGQYQYISSVRPQQTVKDMNYNIKIYEPQGISYVDVYEPSQNHVAFAKVIRKSNTIMEVNYSPDLSQQETIISHQQDEKSGIDGDLVVRYDINHGQDAGYVQIDGDFFVHFFSPSGLKAQPKNIVFVVDRSGSMAGEKIEQTRQAMLYILDQLRPEDAFQMIYFDDKLQFWSTEDKLVEATPAMIQNAKQHVEDHLESGGSTNINAALLEACRILRHQGIRGSSFVIFLTDGHPTSGVTDSKVIARNIDDAAASEVVIFSLGFGFDLQFDLLKEISYRTEGTVRRIYPGSDAAEQIKDFLKGVNTPLMYEITLAYDDNAILPESLTTHSFPQYFNGSELIVAGRMTQDVPTSWTLNVIGLNADYDEIKYTKDISTIQKEVDEIEKQGIILTGFVERLWAYLTIKDLLKKHLIAEETGEQERLYERALDLALRYNLVTPVTSLFIVEADQQDESLLYDENAHVMVGAYPASVQSTSNHIGCHLMAHLLPMILLFMSLYRL